MAIVEMKMYGVECDNCGTQWEQKHTGYSCLHSYFDMQDIIRNDEDWHTEGDKHYCQDCFSFDDDDNLILKYIEKPQNNADKP